MKELGRNLGSTHDYTVNFLDWESWIDLAVLNQITTIEQKYDLAVVEARSGKKRK